MVKDKQETKILDILGPLKTKDRVIQKVVTALFRMKGYNPLYPVEGEKFKLSAADTAPQSVKIVDGDEIIYRRVASKDGLKTKLEGFSTFVEVFEKTVALHGNSPYLGSRKFISEDKVVSNDGKTLIKLELGDYQWLTYKEVFNRIENLKTHFHVLGINKENKFAIFADTSGEWQQVNLTLQRLSSPIVTVYSTLGDEGILHSLNLTEIQGIFVDSRTRERILAMIDKIPSLKFIVASSQRDIKAETIIASDGREIPIFLLDELCNSPHPDYEKFEKPVNPKGDDLLMIMFTSGSTGIPKGVMISHSNILAVLAGTMNFEKNFKGKTYIGYLPLAHIMEYTIEAVFTFYGCQIGYGMPLTLMDNGAMLKNSKGDLGLLRPHYFVAVPLLCERIRNGIITKIMQEKRPKQIVFQMAFNVKAHYHRLGLPTPFLDKLVFNKIKMAFGGRLENMVVGSAKLSAKTEEFLNVCFGGVNQGYGLTETSIGVSIGDFETRNIDNVGAPIMCSEVKLAPVEDGGYDPLDPEHPRGEVCVSGGNVALGYYKNEEVTKEVFVTNPQTGRRWFYTGDIAEITKDMCFRLIDRKKDIIKLKHGEYVPLTKVENVIQDSRFVENVCVAPRKDMECLIAIIVPNKVAYQSVATEIGGVGNIESLDELVNNASIKAKALESINNSLNMGKLEKFERPSVLHILPDEWLPDSGLVTPTFKIRRMAIAQKYSNLLEC